MSSVWTLESGSINDTFAALGLGNLRRTLISQGADVVRFEAPGAAFDGTALVAYDDTVTIKKDGVTWFLGRCNTLPRQGDPGSESISYEIVGPWWYLDHRVYEQSWQLWDTDAGSLQATNKSRVILCQNAAGARVTSGAQITDAVNFAISKGAPIALGTVDPDIQIPWEESVDIMCAEVIIRMLKWSPDCVCWFDYSTATPTFHCRKRSNLSSASLAVTAGSPAQSISITPRCDLQVPGVTLKYEKTHTDAGVAYETIEEDTAGDTDEFDALVSTIQLAGSEKTYVTQVVETSNKPATWIVKAWWKARDTSIADIADADMTIHDGASSGVEGYPRILESGVIHEWMSVDIEEVTASAQIDFKIKDAGADNVNERKNEKLSTNLIMTNATTGTYRRLDSWVSGEATPVGLAQSIYDAWNQLQYDGQFMLLEDEVSSTVHPGKKLNLTGGVAAWASMNALIAQVTEDVDMGLTTITFGPMRHLGPDDLVALLRRFRTRMKSHFFKVRTTGKAEDRDKGGVALGDVGPKQMVVRRPGEPVKLKFKDSAGTYDHTIELDATLVTAEDDSEDHDIKPREISICVDGDVKKAIFMMSSPYD